MFEVSAAYLLYPSHFVSISCDRSGIINSHISAWSDQLAAAKTQVELVKLEDQGHSTNTIICKGPLTKNSLLGP